LTKVNVLTSVFYCLSFENTFEKIEAFACRDSRAPLRKMLGKLFNFIWEKIDFTVENDQNLSPISFREIKISRRYYDEPRSKHYFDELFSQNKRNYDFIGETVLKVFFLD
jgi:hypothetical protein